MSAAEEFDPKKRLVGAAILIGVAVIVLPVILDSDDTIDSAGTSTEEQVFQGLSNEYVSSDEEVTVFVSKITPIVENSGSINKDADTQSTAAPSTPKPSTHAKPAVVQANSSPSSVKRGWVVRIGTFANAGNVEKVLVDLKSKGFEPNSESIETSKGMATRIWIGPYLQRVEAARARTRLEQQTGEPGLITAFP